MKTNLQHRLRQIVVDRVEAEDGHYDVMFIGTGVALIVQCIGVQQYLNTSLPNCILHAEYGVTSHYVVEVVNLKIIS